MKVPILKEYIKFHSEWDQRIMPAKKSSETLAVFSTAQIPSDVSSWRQHFVESSWNVMAQGDAREGKWRRNRRMEWVASTLHTTSEHGLSSITTADAHTSAASSRLNWCPRRFKWTRPFRRKTKSGFCACAITFQLESTAVPSVCGSLVRNIKSRIWCQECNGGSCFEWPIVNLAEPYSMYRPGCAKLVKDFWTDTPVNFANNDKKAKLRNIYLRQLRKITA